MKSIGVLNPNSKNHFRSWQKNDEIYSPLPQGDIFEELKASLKLALEQRSAQFTWTVKKEAACLFCRSAFKWHNSAMSIIDQIKALAYVMEMAQVEAEEKETAEIIEWIPPVVEYEDDLYNWARGG